MDTRALAVVPPRRPLRIQVRRVLQHGPSGPAPPAQPSPAALMPLVTRCPLPSASAPLRVWLFLSPLTTGPSRPSPEPPGPPPPPPASLSPSAPAAPPSPQPEDSRGRRAWLLTVVPNPPTPPGLAPCSGSFFALTMLLISRARGPRATHTPSPSPSTRTGATSWSLASAVAAGGGGTRAACE